MQADELKARVQELKTIQDQKVENVRQALRDRIATRQEQTASPDHYPTPSP